MKIPHFPASTWCNQRFSSFFAAFPYLKPPFLGAPGGLPVLVAPQHGPATADALRGDPGAAGGGLWPWNALGGGAAKPPGGDGLGIPMDIHGGLMGFNGI